MTAANLVLAGWGFLVGFVGWSSCLRLVEPISSWLAPMRPGATAAAVIIRLIVTVFLIAAMISAIAIAPLIMIGGGGVNYRDTSDWRTLLGIAFAGSLTGFVAHGLMRRLWGRDGDGS